LNGRLSDLLKVALICKRRHSARAGLSKKATRALLTRNPLC
jgi:hypothetical protein